MQLTEHVALYLQSHGVPCATTGALPLSPDEACAVIASDLRPAADSQGSRFQILARGKSGEDSGLTLSSIIMELLAGFCGLLDPQSPLILRTTLESGAAKVETDSRGRTTYSMNFRIWHI